MNGRILVSPSILSADFLNLEAEINSLGSHVDYLHIDIMDGHFVPNLTIGPQIVKQIKQRFSTPLDVHIMVANPDQVAQQYLDAGADILTFHVEAAKDSNELAKKIRAHGSKVGVSLRPQTPLSALDRILDEVDVVLVMSVNPGFGGQAFIPDSIERIKALRRQLRGKNLGHVYIEVDGGINEKTAIDAVRAGANMLVAGNYIFKSSDRKLAVRNLQEINV